MLVTGGAGYVGSFAVKALVEAGRRVVVYDDLSAGHRAAAGDADFVEGDILETARVEDTIARHGVSAVMHFAAWLSVGASVYNPVGYYRNNVLGALSVLEAMSRQRVIAFIFSSTAAVYGEPVQTPITESHPLHPINPYGETKLAVERALPHFERAHGIRSVCLRYFNAAGADPEGGLGEDHRPESHLVPLAIDAALGREPLRVFGNDYPTPDGTCLRDYIHVSDLADAHVLALRWLERGGRSATYNLGNGRPHSVREVIEVTERVSGRKVPCALASRRAGDPAVLYASNARIQTELGWQPRYQDLETIIGSAWRWRQAHPNGFA